MTCDAILTTTNIYAHIRVSGNQTLQTRTVYRAIEGSPKTHESICSYWCPKDNPPLCPYYGFKTRPSLYAYNRASKVAPMPVLVSLHAPFYMHIIWYPETPPPICPYFGLQRCPLWVLVLCSPHTHTHTHLHMPIFGSPKATLSVCSEVAPLYIPILASPNTQLSMCLQ